MSGKLYSSFQITTKNYFFFDLDGTLVDSSPHHEVAFKKVLANGYPELAACFDYEVMKGKKTLDVFRELGITGIEQLTTLTETKQRYYREFIQGGEISLYPSGDKLLEYLKSLGKKLFLITGSSHQSTYSVLESCKISDFFDGIITSDDVKLNKPNPDIFLLGLSRFNLDPQQTLTIEDSLNGVEASQKAGIDVVMVNNPKTPKNLSCFESLKDFYLFVRTQYEELDEWE
jgi:HAD superfamily hydrolase (TIGR01509 family)